MDLGITNKYYKKQDIIHINRIKLCFLTEYLIDWEFIKVNDINLLGYDDYLIKLLSEHKEEYKFVIKVVNYVVKRIKSNKYLDEEGNEIRNLLSYFISSCESNITMLKENAEKAGVKQIRIHDFRHSCASLLINNGANVTMVAKYLGHAR